MNQALVFISGKKSPPLAKDSDNNGPQDNWLKRAFVERFFAKCLDSNLRILATSFVIFISVLLLTYPKYLELLSDQNLNITHSYFFNKVNAPLNPFVGATETHGAKIDFRLTVPLLAKAIGVTGTNAKSVVFIYLIQSALLIPFLFVLIKLLLKHLSRSSVLPIVLGISTIYLAKAFIWDYDFWFDGFAYFFLLLGMYFHNRIAIFSTLTLACWTDERAVIALSSIFLFRLLSESDFNIRSVKGFWSVSYWAEHRSNIVLVVAIFYLALRILLSNRFGLHTPTGKGSGVDLSLIPYQLKHRLAGIFLSFEGLWILFVVSVFYLIKKGETFLAFTMMSIMLIHIIIAYSVFDISRSLTYGFPLLILSAVIIQKYDTAVSKQIFRGASLICILLPTQYLIFFPRQITWTVCSYEQLKPVIKGLFFL
ncbi:hypothetical protein [Dyadobacter sp. CY347]|uniref:hypothetical protein n=1 Tax=Dyadobacter sp. CY347 TaxID=2909336 RepID=UPI001F31A4A6|nr:hypothetical protein [Dyadobacter sp. CY347]MCF2489226.1 hypothetical protein [Dyadobacter sp. CY347]